MEEFHLGSHVGIVFFCRSHCFLSSKSITMFYFYRHTRSYSILFHFTCVWWRQRRNNNNLNNTTCYSKLTACWLVRFRHHTNCLQTVNVFVSDTTQTVYGLLTCLFQTPPKLFTDCWLVCFRYHTNCLHTVDLFVSDTTPIVNRLLTCSFQTPHQLFTDCWQHSSRLYSDHPGPWVVRTSLHTGQAMSDSLRTSVLPMPG